jgi:hypothetical protein
MGVVGRRGKLESESNTIIIVMAVCIKQMKVDVTISGWKGEGAFL